MLVQLRRRRAYAPTSNVASQDNHEKINSWVSFIFPLHDEYGAPLGGPSGRRSSAISQTLIQNSSVAVLKSLMSFHIEHCFWETCLKTDLFLVF